MSTQLKSKSDRQTHLVQCDVTTQHDYNWLPRAKAAVTTLALVSLIRPHTLWYKPVIGPPEVYGYWVAIAIATVFSSLIIATCGDYECISQLDTASNVSTFRPPDLPGLRIPWFINP